jgi:hypothetical protein
VTWPFSLSILDVKISVNVLRILHIQIFLLGRGFKFYNRVIFFSPFQNRFPQRRTLYYEFYCFFLVFYVYTGVMDNILYSAAKNRVSLPGK